jgi:hypothetical protein
VGGWQLVATAAAVRGRSARGCCCPVEPSPRCKPRRINILIDSIVRQTTVLIAQLATSGGVRAPLAHVANQVFLELTRELDAQGVSRKVSADMFGMALRSYLRRIHGLSESSTERGRTLWEVVLEYLGRGEVRSRARRCSHASAAMIRISCAACCTT